MSATETEKAPIEVTIEADEPWRKVLRVTVPAGRIREKLDERYGEMGESLPVPGFRPGHVPRRILERRFGGDVETEVKDGLIAESLKEAIEGKKLVLLGDPKIEGVEFIPAERLTYKAEFRARPDFALPTLKGISVKPASTAVTEEDVDSAIRMMAQESAPLSSVTDGALEAEDAGIFEAKIQVDGEVVFEQANLRLDRESAAVFDLPFPGFWDAALGLRVGEARESRCPVPPAHPLDRLRGKEAALSLKLNDIKRRQAPAVDDAFARGIGAADLAALRSVFRDKLEHLKSHLAAQTRQREIEDYLLAGANLDLPEDFVKPLAEKMVEHQEKELRDRGVSEETLAREGGTIREAAAAGARRTLKLRMVFDRIAEEEKILVTEEDVERVVDALAHGRGESPLELGAALEREGRLVEIRERIRDEKVFKGLLSHIKVEEPAPPPARA